MAVDLHIRITSSGSEDLTRKLTALNAAMARAAQTSDRTLLQALKREETGLLRQQRTIDSALRSYQRLHAQMMRMGAPGTSIGGLARSFNSLDRALSQGVVSGQRFQEVTHRYARATDNARETLRRFAAENRRNNTGLQQGAVHAGTFSKRMRDVGSSAVIALGPLSGVGSRIIALLAIFQRGSSILAASFTAGFIGLVIAIGHAVAAAARFQRQMSTLNAVIKASGREHEITATQVDSMAFALAKSTLASTTEARSAATTLLTFRNLSTNMINDVLVASQNLAEAGFGTLAENARSLGRVLEFPAEGLDSLREKGIILLPSLKRLIKDLVAFGQEGKAAGLILAEINKRAGGAGAGSTPGLTDALDTLRESWVRLLESLGNLLPLQQLGELVITVADAFERLSIMAGRAPSFVPTSKEGLLERQKLLKEQINTLENERRGILESRAQFFEEHPEGTIFSFGKMADPDHITEKLIPLREQLGKVEDALLAIRDAANRASTATVHGLSAEQYDTMLQKTKELGLDAKVAMLGGAEGFRLIEKETLAYARSILSTDGVEKAFVITTDEFGNSVEFVVGAFREYNSEVQNLKRAELAGEIRSWKTEMETFNQALMINQTLLFEGRINTEQFAEAVRRAAGFTENDFKTAIETFNEKMLMYNILLREGAFNLEQFKLASARAKEELASNFPVVEKLESGVQSLSDAIVDFAFDSENALENFKKAFVNILRDISAELLRMSITNPLLNRTGIGAERPVIGDFIGALGSLIGGFSGRGGGVGGTTAARSFGVSPTVITGSYQHGGSFTTPAGGSSDSHLFMAKLSPKEHVEITPQGQSRGGGPTVFIDARGSDKEGYQKLERLIVSLNGSIEQRAVAAVVNARSRSPRLLG